MNVVLRRSLPSLGGLVGLLMAVGFVAVATVGAPLWFPVVLAIVVIVAQYAVNPLIIEWLVPAVVVGHNGERYALDHPLCESVARRCRDAGIPLVKLAIVDDGTPNAFTFGRTPRDARMYVTRGLIERLDETELDAVVAHEVGHVKNWDFAVMTVAAVVPMVLYLLYLTTRSSRDARHVAIGAYAAYVVSQFIVLALSRAREYGADHWSCECTGNGDALASALVKIAYGMGRVSADEKEQVAALVAKGKEGAAAARELQARSGRARSMRAMGIFEPKSAEAMAYAFSTGIDPDRAVAALRWDAVNPWAKVLEKLSSHPLVVNRIRALEESGLPGAPTRFSVLRMMAQGDQRQIMDARARFGKELAIGAAPYGIVVPFVLFGAFTGSAIAVGFALSAAGVLFFVKQHLRYPSGHEQIDDVASLLERLDAGPMAGIAVDVKGKIIGRGFPGYRLSPDLVLEDQSGFVPLVYRQPLPFLATLFGLLRAQKFIGQEVVARGWYRRTPGPAIELEKVFAGNGNEARCFTSYVRYAGSGALILIGLLITVGGLGG